MEVIHQRCAGMDVSKTDAKVCIRVQGRGSRKTSAQVTTCPARSSAILELGRVLRRAKVTCVVMEATGDYWKPFFYLLAEADLPVMLANPRQVRQIPGRKTDVADAVWLADLAAHGLVRGSFVPDKHLREVKDLVRYRTTVTRLRTQELQRLEKVLESAAVKLSSVIANINGVSGRRMLDALVAGERDPQVLAGLGHKSLKATADELAEALTGGFTDHHAFLVRTHLQLIDGFTRQIQDFDARIEGYFTHDDPDPPSGRLSWGKARELLATIPGIKDLTAEQILAEIGTDMTVFPTPARLASWAGLAPGLNESAGRQHSSTCRPGNRFLKGALGQAARSAANTRDTFFSARFKRVTAKRGASRALVAVARSMLTAIWHMLTKAEPYHDLGAGHYARRRPGATMSNALTKLRQAGYHIIPTPDGILVTQT